MSSTQAASEAGRGEFVVEQGETTFGRVLRHGLDGLCLFMILPARSGWKPMQYYTEQSDGSLSHGAMGAVLSHQTYRKKVEAHLEQHPSTREVAVVSLDTGEWKTVWLRDGEDAVADNR